MKRQLTAAIGMAALLATAAGCGSGRSPGQDQAASAAAASGTMTVWLMGEAQTSWPELVQQVNDEFAAKYPKVELRLRYQTWKDKIANLDEALKGERVPDVVELGNTETMKYILNGSLAPVDRTTFDNNQTWIRGLVNTCTYQDKLFCVPYYAGARVAIYNSAMFQDATGSSAVPATEDDLLAALDKVQARNRGTKNFSPLYLPGPYWYAAMSYVAAYGGAIARFDNGGRWHGTLGEEKAQQGIQHFVDLVKRYNHDDLTVNELDQAAVLGKHRTAMLYGNGWEAAAALEPLSGDPKLKDVVKVAGMPGPNGKPLPSFIGGSDLAVTAKSQVQDLAKDWIRMFTSAKSQQVLADKDTLPNNLTQLAPLKSKPATAAAANAVPDAWFTPVAPGWAAIEKQNVLVDMLNDIFRGTSVAAATKAADAKIDELINNPS
ncbi:extracellular solute-binding protein [Kitasatospora sp. DSM 101779]|uniref:extracellular solute-binding protein n=1 Tax=Kitasatospora sp. DSM 101779 TaxID=2853165 RepID=UPI0021DB3A16|nr:extracellular solute-binding protein [Kitasatospora sp. DSM 101779]MCU7822907.1 extracellular solute-binding protein [Kitasatospora sp. DSM 101779]